MVFFNKNDNILNQSTTIHKKSTQLETEVSEKDQFNFTFFKECGP